MKIAELEKLLFNVTVALLAYYYSDILLSVSILK